MAELLLKASYVPHPDPEQDAMRYKPGMVVVVMPDGHPWGAEEGLPNFYLLKLPGVAVETVKKYLDAPGNRRRVWQVQVNSLPAAAKNAMNNKGQITIKVGTFNGEATLTWKQVRSYIKNLDTGLTEDGEL